MIRAIQKVHEKGIIHRDLKPSNFCVEKDKMNPVEFKIYIIDFGLSKPYMQDNGKHIPYSKKEGRGMTGTR